MYYLSDNASQNMCFQCDVNEAHETTFEPRITESHVVGGAAILAMSTWYHKG